MGSHGPSGELGPLAQALQRRRSAAVYQDQQTFPLTKYMAPPLPPTSPKRKPLGDCNGVPNRAVGPMAAAQRPSGPSVPRSNSSDLTSRKNIEGVEHRHSASGCEQKPCASGSEQRPESTRSPEHRPEHRPNESAGLEMRRSFEHQQSFEHRRSLEHRRNLELRPSAGVESRENGASREQHKGADAGFEFRGNRMGFDPRHRAPSHEPRPGAASLELCPNMVGFEPRPRSAAAFEAQPSATGSKQQRPGVAATGVEKQPGGAQILDKYHNAACAQVYSPRHGHLPAPGPDQPRSRPSQAPPQHFPHPEAHPQQPHQQKHQQEPNSIARPAQQQQQQLHDQQKQKQEPNSIARPAQQQQQHYHNQQKQHQQQKLDGPHAVIVRQPSMPNLERPSLGPLAAAAAANFATSQRRPSGPAPPPLPPSAAAATATTVLRASTGALTRPSAPHAASTAKPITTAATKSAAKGASTVATVTGRGSADSISWMAICAEGRAEADRKRGLTMPAEDKSELKLWLYHDIMQRQGSTLSAQKSIVFPPALSGP